MSSAPAGSDTPGVVRSLIPARIDRLPWTLFHTRLVVALGVAWILDGLEITLASLVMGSLTRPETLNLSAAASAGTATVYLVGQVVGALFFGRMTDRFGRKNLFLITLAVYLVGSGLTAATAGSGTWWVVYLYATRFIAGMGIGGEYAAINSAIDELIPARYRGRVDIGVNGTYWAGSVVGALVQLAVYNQFLQDDPSLAWRIGFLIGPVLGLVIILVRRNLPESPRWQLMNGRAAEAEESITRIEAEVRERGGTLEPVAESRALEIRPARHTGYLRLVRVLFRDYPKRSVYALTLMVTQSFLYNAIYFTYAMVLGVFFDVRDADIPLYGLAFAVGNLLGPLTLGWLFDIVGRKQMIAGTYLASGTLLLVSGLLFRAGLLTATTQTAAWVIVFFFASAGASAGYLTVGEIFPLEVRGKAIAVFFSIAQLVGAVAPLFYGALIDDANPDPHHLFLGYAVGAALMITGGLVAAVLGVAAEGRSLEDIAVPLSVKEHLAEQAAERADIR
ncbi:MFS transporter [Streptomyces sp. 11x1]|uniref:MFS transporter n=1 Tax=Streptomyces sp. 11x1 TaxID=3038642 RepID=UPI00292E2A83|nr:MFS transporter [Streptomyces sp. 11x1]WNZ12532.1 MFS transporter [Streptomyces sp. 11x1]